ncbi:unnamed protein product [Mycena citricolor]|uniref:Uncharacterized protein n=1 Tax=Mycena citricolor TaxID=2018698 RepID=A0AAD2H343_9AGAR|nr:unnamed protein product [Mycena citricolor]
MLSALAVLVSLAAAASAHPQQPHGAHRVQTKTNDWNVACRGNCSYDLPEGGASIHLSGGNNAVSDITHAGGWTILSCNQTALVQTVRATCHSTDCEHLFAGHGPVDTVVRLPESCGPAPFARIANVTADPNQTVHARYSKYQHARWTPGQMKDKVFLLEMDVDFASVDPSTTGPVSFYVSTNSTGTAPSARGLDARNNWTAYNATPTITLPPVKINQTFPLASASISCPGFNASVATEFALNVDTAVTMGMTMTGTVIPAKITQLDFFAGLDGSILGKLGVQAAATGGFSTGKVSLYQVAIPGYSVPGIFSVGPTFTVYGKADLELDASLDVSLDLSYQVSGARVYVPASATPPGVVPAKSNFTLALTPDFTATANVTASLIPELAVGLSAFSGLAKAEVFLNLEADAGISLSSLNASADARVTGTGSAAVSGQVAGCVDINSGFSVNVGADGKLFNIISAAVSTPLYANSWDLYNTCFAASGSKNNGKAARRSAGLTRRAALVCPASASATTLQQFISQFLQALPALPSASALPSLPSLTAFPSLSLPAISGLPTVVSKRRL